MSAIHVHARGWLLAVVLGVASATLAEPYVFPDAWTDVPAAEVVPGGVLRLSVSELSRTYNPLVSVESNLIVGMNTGSGFGAATLGWRRPDDGALEPRAAESWLFSADGLTVDVTLRPELRWSDGTPITASDYLTSYRLQVDPEANAAGPEVWMVGDQLITVESTGTHSLRVRFPTTDRLAMQTVAYLYPLPDHVFGAAFRSGGSAAVKALWGPLTPPSELVFSGYMRLKDVTEERITFERNPYFGDWNVDAAGRPLPYLDGVTYTIAEQETSFNLFLTGALDAFRARTIDDIGVINDAIVNEGLDAVVVESVYPIESTYFLAFNWNLASDPFKQGLFRDPDFRRAVAHVVDRQAIIDLVYSGAGFALSGPVHPAYRPWFDEDLEVPGFDPSAAATLLAGIGFTRRDDDGFFIDAQGRRAGFTLAVAGGTAAEQAASVFADTAREAGIDVRPQSYPFALLVDLLTTHGDERGFEVVYIGLTPSDTAWPLEDGIHSCTGALHVYNLSGDCLSVTERLIGELVRRGRTTLDDEEAVRIAHEVQKLEAELSAMIYTAVPAEHFVSSGRVRGYHPRELWTAKNGFGTMFLFSLR